MLQKKLSHTTKILLFVIVIIATFFRIYNLPTVPGGLYPDEAMNANNAVESLSTNNFKVFYPENNGREGLFANIEAMSISIFGNEAWAIRLVSALFGIFTIIGLFFLVRELFKDKEYSDKIALISSFLLSISFWHINFSRIGFRAIMAPFFLVWSLYFLFIAFNILKSKLKANKNIVLYIISAISGLIYGLGMHSYIAYRATPLLIIFMFILFWRLFNIDFKRIAIVFMIFVIFSLFSFSPLGIYFIKNPQDFMGRTSQVSIMSSSNPIKTLTENTIKTLAMFNIQGDGNWRHNYSERPQLQWLIGIMLILGLLIESLIIIFRKKMNELFSFKSSRERTFLILSLFIWIIVGFLPVIMSSEGIPHALRAILVIPAIYIFAGFGIWDIYIIASKYISKKVIIDVGIFISLLLIMQAYTLYFIAWAQNSNTKGAFAQHYADIGEKLTKIPDDIQKYIVVNAGGVLVRGIPMPAQTIMFLSDSFVKEHRETHNIYYILPEEEKNIPKNNSVVFYMEEK